MPSQSLSRSSLFKMKLSSSPNINRSTTTKLLADMMIWQMISSDLSLLPHFPRVRCLEIKYWNTAAKTFWFAWNKSYLKTLEVFYQNARAKLSWGCSACIWSLLLAWCYQIYLMILCQRQSLPCMLAKPDLILNLVLILWSWYFQQCKTTNHSVFFMIRERYNFLRK